MKKIIKKFLLFVLIFVTFTGGTFASSKLPNGKKPNERLMKELRGAVRFLDSHYQTGEEVAKQDKAKTFVSNVLKDSKFRGHAVLAFDDVEKERIRSYNKALEGTDQDHIEAMLRGVENMKALRVEFGL